MVIQSALHKGSEIDIKNNNENKDKKKKKEKTITTIKTKLYKNVFEINFKQLRIENDYT